MNKELEQDEIEFGGEITPAIFLRLQYLHLGWRRFAAFLVIPIALCVTLTGKPDIALTVITIITGIIVALIMLWWQRVSFLRTYKKSPYLQEGLQGAIAQDGFRVKSRTGQSDLHWTDFIKVKYADDIVLLYRGPNLMNFLARELFPDETTWEKAIALIKDHTAPKGV